MYNDTSVPVRMPSYRIHIGTQWMWRLCNDDFFGFSYETGHYSNGQEGCTYNDKIKDGTPEATALYQYILDHPDIRLSDSLNRRSGEFSTNETDILLTYRLNHLNDNKEPDLICALTGGLNIYHDQMLYFIPLGGYSPEAIKIYGQIRYVLSCDLAYVLQDDHWIIPQILCLKKPFPTIKKGGRISLNESIEKINHSANRSVELWRFQTTLSYFFPNNFGIYIRHVWGHDNYNIRFVDSGSFIAGGVAWNIFPTFPIRNQKSKKEMEQEKK